MLSDVLSPALVPWVSGTLAFLGAVGLTPIVGWAARKGGWVAIPEDEKWHDTPTSLMGGIAIFAAGAIVLSVGDGGAAFPQAVWAGAGLLFLTGLVDDLWALGPVAKLATQLTSAALVLSAGLLFAPTAPLWVSVPLTVVWLLGLPNALNLLDAMDGIAAGIAALAALFFGLVAGLQGEGALAAAALVTAGATAGFLVFNVAPASIFMGDCGSLVLGYVLAVLGLGIQGSGGAGGAALIPVLILAVPIFDTTFVSVTRTQRGDSVTNGGVDHTMHRLVRLGWTERQTLLLMGGAGVLTGGVGVVGQVGPILLFYVLLAVALATAVGVGKLLALQTDPAPRTSPQPELAPELVDRNVSSGSSRTRAEIESEEPVSRSTP